MRVFSLLFVVFTLALSACGGALIGPNGRLIRVVVDGDQIVFDDPILFAHDSDEILHDSDALLDRIAEVFSENPDIVGATIEGHTDVTGSQSHNMDLSQRRAESVVQALESRGVTQSLHAVGVGPNRPLCQDDTDSCHQQNRRVEIHVTR